MMTPEQKTDMSDRLRKIADMIDKNETEWVAVQLMFKNYRMIIHSKDAPARPRGL